MLSPAVTDSPFLDLDWFNPNTQDYWSNEFVNYFNPETGIDIDGAWIVRRLLCFLLSPLTPSIE